MRAQEDPPEEPPWLLPENSSWEWGEIYIWGGVTFSPSSVPEEERVEDRELEEVAQVKASASPAAPLGAEVTRAPAGVWALRQRVWAAVSEQYRTASRDGSFAGNPVSPALATSRFANLVEVLGIPGEAAAELVEIDATPLLVEPDGVASAFEMLSGLSSKMKALELVRCHPGLLVGGGVRGLKEGAGLVTSSLVDVLYAGRLLRVMEDRNTDNERKLAEIENYARAAAVFKPVMDLLQRRGRELSVFLQNGVPFLVVPVVALACVQTLLQLGLTPSSVDADVLAFEMALAMLVFWFASLSGHLGHLGLIAGSWLFSLGSGLLSLSSSLVSLLPFDQIGAASWQLSMTSWLLHITASLLGSLSGFGGLPALP